MSDVMNFAKAEEMINAIIDRNGEDYVYGKTHYPGSGDGSCWYSNGETLQEAIPGCIVGHLLVDIDVPIAEIWGMEHVENSSGSLQSLRYAFECRWGVKFTDKAALFLSYVQRAQDDGVSWGRARSRAYERLAETSAIFLPNEMYAAAPTCECGCGAEISG